MTETRSMSERVPAWSPSRHSSSQCATCRGNWPCYLPRERSHRALRPGSGRRQRVHEVYPARRVGAWTLCDARHEKERRTRSSLLLIGRSWNGTRFSSQRARRATPSRAGSRARRSVRKNVDLKCWQALSLVLAASYPCATACETQAIAFRCLALHGNTRCPLQAPWPALTITVGFGVRIEALVAEM